MPTYQTYSLNSESLPVYLSGQSPINTTPLPQYSYINTSQVQDDLSWQQISPSINDGFTHLNSDNHFVSQLPNYQYPMNIMSDIDSSHMILPVETIHTYEFHNIGQSSVYNNLNLMASPNMRQCVNNNFNNVIYQNNTPEFHSLNRDYRNINSKRYTQLSNTRQPHMINKALYLPTSSQYQFEDYGVPENIYHPHIKNEIINTTLRKFSQNNSKNTSDKTIDEINISSLSPKKNIKYLQPTKSTTVSRIKTEKSLHDVPSRSIFLTTENSTNRTHEYRDIGLISSNYDKEGLDTQDTLISCANPTVSMNSIRASSLVTNSRELYENNKTNVSRHVTVGPVNPNNIYKATKSLLVKSNYSSENRSLKKKLSVRKSNEILTEIRNKQESNIFPEKIIRKTVNSMSNMAQMPKGPINIISTLNTSINRNKNLREKIHIYKVTDPIRKQNTSRNQSHLDNIKPRKSINYDKGVRNPNNHYWQSKRYHSADYNPIKFNQNIYDNEKMKYVNKEEKLNITVDLYKFKSENIESEKTKNITPKLSSNKVCTSKSKLRSNNNEGKVNIGSNQHIGEPREIIKKHYNILRNMIPSKLDYNINLSCTSLNVINSELLLQSSENRVDYIKKVTRSNSVQSKSKQSHIKKKKYRSIPIENKLFRSNNENMENKTEKNKILTKRESIHKEYEINNIGNIVTTEISYINLIENQPKIDKESQPTILNNSNIEALELIKSIEPEIQKLKTNTKNKCIRCKRRNIKHDPRLSKMAGYCVSKKKNQSNIKSFEYGSNTELYTSDHEKLKLLNIYKQETDLNENQMDFKNLYSKQHLTNLDVTLTEKPFSNRYSNNIKDKGNKINCFNEQKSSVFSPINIPKPNSMINGLASISRLNNKVNRSEIKSKYHFPDTNNQTRKINYLDSNNKNSKDSGKYIDTIKTEGEKQNILKNIENSIISSDQNESDHYTDKTIYEVKYGFSPWHKLKKQPSNISRQFNNDVSDISYLEYAIENKFSDQELRRVESISKTIHSPIPSYRNSTWKHINNLLDELISPSQYIKKPNFNIQKESNENKKALNSTIRSIKDKPSEILKKIHLNDDLKSLCRNSPKSSAFNTSTSNCYKSDKVLRTKKEFDHISLKSRTKPLDIYHNNIKKSEYITRRSHPAIKTIKRFSLSSFNRKISTPSKEISKASTSNFEIKLDSTKYNSSNKSNEIYYNRNNLNKEESNKYITIPDISVDKNLNKEESNKYITIPDISVDKNLIKVYTDNLVKSVLMKCILSLIDLEKKVLEVKLNKFSNINYNQSNETIDQGAVSSISSPLQKRRSLALEVISTGFKFISSRLRSHSLNFEIKQSEENKDILTKDISSEELENLINKIDNNESSIYLKQDNMTNTTKDLNCDHGSNDLIYYKAHNSDTSSSLFSNYPSDSYLRVTELLPKLSDESNSETNSNSYCTGRSSNTQINRDYNDDIIQNLNFDFVATNDLKISYQNNLEYNNESVFDIVMKKLEVTQAKSSKEKKHLDSSGKGSSYKELLKAYKTPVKDCNDMFMSNTDLKNIDKLKKSIKIADIDGYKIDVSATELKRDISESENGFIDKQNISILNTSPKIILEICNHYSDLNSLVTEDANTIVNSISQTKYKNLTPVVSSKGNEVSSPLDSPCQKILDMIRQSPKNEINSNQEKLLQTPDIENIILGGGEIYCSSLLSPIMTNRIITTENMEKISVTDLRREYCKQHNESDDMHTSNCSIRFIRVQDNLFDTFDDNSCKSISNNVENRSLLTPAFLTDSINILDQEHKLRTQSSFSSTNSLSSYYSVTDLCPLTPYLDLQSDNETSLSDALSFTYANNESDYSRYHSITESLCSINSITEQKINQADITYATKNLPVRKNLRNDSIINEIENRNSRGYKKSSQILYQVPDLENKINQLFAINNDSFSSRKTSLNNEITCISRSSRSLTNSFCDSINTNSHRLKDQSPFSTSREEKKFKKKILSTSQTIWIQEKKSIFNSKNEIDPGDDIKIDQVKTPNSTKQIYNRLNHFQDNPYDENSYCLRKNVSATHISVLLRDYPEHREIVINRHKSEPYNINRHQTVSHVLSSIMPTEEYISEDESNVVLSDPGS